MPKYSQSRYQTIEIELHVTFVDQAQRGRSLEPDRSFDPPGERDVHSTDSIKIFCPTSQVSTVLFETIRFGIIFKPDIRNYRFFHALG